MDNGLNVETGRQNQGPAVVNDGITHEVSKPPRPATTTTGLEPVTPQVTAENAAR